MLSPWVNQQRRVCSNILSVKQKHAAFSEKAATTDGYFIIVISDDTKHC